MAQRTNSETLERLTLTGGPRERGVEHGETYASEIESNLEQYLTVFNHYGADSETVYEEAEAFVDIIESENAEYFDEMHGIAEGSGLNLLDITILNARYEVMYSAYAEAAADAGEEAKPDGCTAFGAQPEITAEGHTIIGQNWDWIPSIDIFVMDIRREGGPNMVAMTEAGIVGGKIGINEAGIGMVLNGLIAEGDGENPHRKPYHVRFREALDAWRLDESIVPFLETDRANSANILLGHSEGEMIDLELAPETANYLYPEDGLLIHANHFEGNADVSSRFEKILPSTLCRAPRLKRLLAAEKGAIDVDVATETLQDHFGKPASICSHVDESVAQAEQDQTDGSFVLDLTEKRLVGTDGPPCENDYVVFDVAS